MSARKLKRSPAPVVREPTRTVKKTAPAIPKSVLNQVRDNMREASRGLGSLYFEARVVVSTSSIKIGSTAYSELVRLASRSEFRVENDCFIYNSTKLDRVKEQLAELHRDLVANGLKIWRYRISEVMMDSNNFDTLNLL